MSKTNKILIGLAVLLLAVLTVYGYIKAVPGNLNQSGSQPKIEILPLTFDFGEVAFGRVAQTTFKIKNVGQSVLEIRRVTTSCSCTTAKVSRDKLEPSEEAELDVQYDTAAMGKSSHGLGLQERIIYVKTNDPVTPQVEVTTSAVVK
ncbi:MAG: DUF1573 domain-containing protein [Patescibacteria group bacterium]